MIEGFAWGGLLQQTTDVENYPGFPEGVMGPEMMQSFRDQAERFGARLVTEQAERVELASEPGGIHRVWVGEEEHRARTVVLAMGAEHKKLGVPGEADLAGRGVSYCATCDAAFFKDAPTLIVGGGDSAMEEAIFLVKFASKVTSCTAATSSAPRRSCSIAPARRRTSSSSRPTASSEFVPADRRRPRARAPGATRETGEPLEVPITGSFIAIGHEPQSELVREQIDLDENGYVITEGSSTRTNRPGVFAAGDLVDHTYRQAVTAAGSGCQAALDAEWYLRDTPEVPRPAEMPAGDPALAQWAAWPRATSEARATAPRTRPRRAPAPARTISSERALELQQPALALQPAAVAAEPAAGVQHAVAGDHDRDRV